MLSDEKIANIENGGKALDTLRELHKKAWNEFKSLKFDNVEVVKEGRRKKKEDKKEVEEPQYVVFLIVYNLVYNF